MAEFCVRLSFCLQLKLPVPIAGPSAVQDVTEATEEMTVTLRALAKTATGPDASDSLIAGAAAFLFLHINILGLVTFHRCSLIWGK